MQTHKRRTGLEEEEEEKAGGSAVAPVILI